MSGFVITEKFISFVRLTLLKMYADLNELILVDEQSAINEKMEVVAYYLKSSSMGC